jgi:hypothetical protein
VVVVVVAVVVVVVVVTRIRRQRGRLTIHYAVNSDPDLCADEQDLRVGTGATVSSASCALPPLSPSSPSPGPWPTQANVSYCDTKLILVCIIPIFTTVTVIFSM